MTIVVFGSINMDLVARVPHPPAAGETLSAGDAFNGGLAAALAEGQPFLEAVRWGMAAGALAVTRPGAQSAMPGRDEVLKLLG
jgi:ribokinase